MELSVWKILRKYNCLNYFGRARGVVTGTTTAGVVPDEEQTPEVWIAVNYSLASAFMMRGLSNEAMQIIKAMHSVVWEQSGLLRSTPEAMSCEEVTQEMIERIYKFIRMERGGNWMPPGPYTMEELSNRKMLQV